jgi:hypothetical protein
MTAAVLQMHSNIIKIIARKKKEKFKKSSSSSL